MFRAPVTIGRENGRPSTWFRGYNEKFFYDRGVLYRFLYGRAALPMALRFLLKNRAEMFGGQKEKENDETASREAGLSMGQAFSLMRKGIGMKE